MPDPEIVEAEVNKGSLLQLAWENDPSLPLLFADHLSLLSVDHTIFLVFGQTQVPSNLNSGSASAVIKPLVRLAVPSAVAVRIAAILTQAVGKE